MQTKPTTESTRLSSLLAFAMPFKRSRARPLVLQHSTRTGPGAGAANGAPAAQDRSRLRRRAQWRLAVLTELAEPAFMQLASIRDARLNIIDFEWSSATALVAVMLDRAGVDLAGKRLRDVLLAHPEGAAVFEAYRQVATDWSGLTVVTARLDTDADLPVIHTVAACRAGLLVSLTNPSAIRRLEAAQIAMREHVLDDSER